MTLATGRRGMFTGSAAAALAASLPLPALGQAKPVKIGLLTVKTGPLAQGGIQMEQGISLFLKHRGNRLAGRTAELIIADTGGNPAGARTKAQELIERTRSISLSARSPRSNCWPSATTPLSTGARS